MKLIKTNLSIPFIKNLVKQLDRHLHDNLPYTRNINHLRCVLDSYDQKTYLQFLSEFVRIKPYIDEITEYNKYRLHTGKHYDLNIIEWHPGSKTKIHSHPENGCIVKSLQGVLQETRYSTDLNVTKKNMFVPVHRFTGKHTHSYFLGKDVLHSIKNMDVDSAYSLHVYSPPDYTPKIFD